jgi:very-short-patch-repair endonuclease
MPGRQRIDRRVSSLPIANLVKELARADRDKHEAALDAHLRCYGLPQFCREYRFAAVRVGWVSHDGDQKLGVAGKKLRDLLREEGLQDWRFDFAWPRRLIAVEIEGGGERGRHARHKGFLEDCRKYNAATKLGWRVYRFTGQQVQSAEAVKFIADVLESRI